MARFHWAVRFGTVRYGTQLCPFPLSEVVNGTKIANCTIPLFWYPFVGVPSTAKGTKRVELNSLQNVDWLTRIVTCAWYKGIKLLLHSFRSAVFCLLHQSVQTQTNITVYFIILYFHTDKRYSRLSVSHHASCSGNKLWDFLLRSRERSRKPFQCKLNINIIIRYYWKTVFL